MTATAAALPLLLLEVEVARAERVSPSVVRVHLAHPDLAHLGVDGPTYDQRVKLVFPHERTGGLVDVAAADESVLARWRHGSASEQGHMRTYTVRDVVGEGPGTRLVVDLVVHEPASGPGSRWAAHARPGDRVVLVAPRRGEPFGGIEFAPPSQRDLLLVGDETALPAIAATLAQLEPEARGTAYVEVPVAADRQPLRHPAGVGVRWVVRDGRPHGEALVSAVRRHLGLPGPGAAVADREVDPELWETPAHSSSGEPLPSAGGTGEAYAWVAGEARLVTALRRALVGECGLPRDRVAFMGYWREGVAMRS